MWVISGHVTTRCGSYYFYLYPGVVGGGRLSDVYIKETCLDCMSVLGGSSVFKRDVPAKAEYSLYAKVSDTPSPFNDDVQPLTEDQFIEHSDCMYQRIWKKTLQPHFKAGLLFCRKGDNIEREDSMRYAIKDRTMFLILCETEVTHYEGRGLKWNKVHEDMTPGNYIYLSWNLDHLFTTADGKSIQLKVVDAHPVAAQQRPAMTWLESGGGADSSLAQMKTLLHQMKLSSNK
jgi:hypothetical protein